MSAVEEENLECVLLNLNLKHGSRIIMHLIFDAESANYY
jgi:hypothetical protein